MSLNIAVGVIIILLFTEFDCFRICRNITMHRSSYIDLAMRVGHGQWLAGTAIFATENISREIQIYYK